MQKQSYGAALLLTAVLLFIASMVLALTGHAAQASPVPIDHCQSITTSGSYSLTGPINSPSGDCLIIAAPEVTLDAQFGIGGTAFKGIGIHVLKGADVFTLNGQHVFIAGFNTAVQVDANDADITMGAPDWSFGARQNHVGVLLNGSNSSSVAAGIESNITAMDVGLKIVGGANNLVTGVNPPSSRFMSDIEGFTYGILIQNSTGNLIANTWSVGGNGGGILLTGNSSNNMIVSNTVTATTIGIRASATAPGNFILNDGINTGSGNSSGFDLFQGTLNGGTGCNGNIWRNNFTQNGTALTFNQPCIGQ